MMELKYRRPDGTFVAQINGLPYHIIEDDPLFDNAVVQAHTMGDDLPPEPSLPLAPPAPAEILRHQGLLALLEFGITEAMVMAKVDEIEGPVERERTRIRFMQPNWRRDSEFISWGGEKFNLTSEQIDQLFLFAATQ